jgi:hypothetical protein
MHDHNPHPALGIAFAIIIAVVFWIVILVPLWVIFGR